MNIGKALRRLGPWATFEYLVNPLFTILSTPLIIKFTGLRGFSSWIIFITSIAFGVALVSGISIALGRYISANKSDQHLCQRAKLDALHLMLGGSFFASIISVTIFYVSDGELSISIFDLNLIFLTIGFATIFDCFDTIFNGILKGNLRYGTSAKTEAIARFIQICLILPTVSLTGSIIALFYASCLGSFIRFFIRMQACNLQNFNLSIIFKHRLQKSSPIIPSAKWVSIQNIGGALYVSFDKFIISIAFGSSTLALYATASQLTNQIQSVLGAAFSVLSNSAATQTSSSELQNSIKKCLSLTFWVAIGSSLTYAIFYIFNQHIFTAWVGAQTAKELGVYVPVVAFAALLQTISIPAYFYLIGRAKFKLVAVTGILSSVVSILFLILSSIYFDPQSALISRATYGFCLLFYVYHLINLKLNNQ